MPAGAAHLKPKATGEHIRDASAGARWTSLWLGTIVVVGAVLRLVALGYKSFWLDEIASVSIARLPEPAFWSMLWRAEGNMALYYVLLRPWLYLGTGEASMRVLSTVLGIASIPIVFFLARRLLGNNAARVATLFFSLNACAIWVSQEARGYSLLVLAVLISTYVFVCFMERPTWALASAYGAVTGLALYCHYFGLLVPAAQLISLMALPAGRRRPWKKLTLSASIILLAAIPVLWMIHIQDIGHITWVERPSLLELYHVGAYLAAGSGKAVGALLLLLDVVLLVLFLRNLKAAWSRREPDLLWRHVLVASSLLTPMVLALLVSVVRPIFYHRFLIVGLPAWVLMTAAGAEAIGSRRWRWLAIAGVCGLSLVSAIASYSRIKEDWRGVATYLIAQARPEDRVLYYQPEGFFAVENYRNWLPGGSAPRPPGIAVNLGNDGWEGEIRGAARVWLVLYRNKPDDPAVPAIEARLTQHYKMELRVPFRAVTVVEYGGGK